MVRLKIVLNKDYMIKQGITEEELLREARQYAIEHDIRETSELIFEKDGEHAMCLFFIMIDKVIVRDLNLLFFYYKLEIDDDGNIEDWIDEMEEYERGKGRIKENSELDRYFKERKERKKKEINFKLVVDERQWNVVSEKGYPEEYSWCFLILKTEAEGEYDYFVGGYIPDRKCFWVNFGLGGAVVDDNEVFAWAPFENAKIESF